MKENFSNISNVYFFCSRTHLPHDENNVHSSTRVILEIHKSKITIEYPAEKNVALTGKCA